MNKIFVLFFARTSTLRRILIHCICWFIFISYEIGLIHYAVGPFPVGDYLPCILPLEYHIFLP